MTRKKFFFSFLSHHGTINTMDKMLKMFSWFQDFSSVTMLGVYLHGKLKTKIQGIEVVTLKLSVELREPKSNFGYFIEQKDQRYIGGKSIYKPKPANAPSGGNKVEKI